LLDNSASEKRAENSWKSRLFLGFVSSLSNMRKDEVKKSKAAKAPGPGSYDIDRAFHALKGDDSRGVRISPEKSDGWIVSKKNHQHKSEEHYHPIPQTDASKLGPAYYKNVNKDAIINRRSHHVPTSGGYWV
jgi:hypothetical protein